MTPCSRLQDWISARLDGEIDSETRRVVEEHLVACTHCQAMEARYLWAKRAFSRPANHEKAPQALHLWLKGVLEEKSSSQRRRKAYAWVGLFVFIIIIGLSAGRLFFPPIAADGLGAREVNVVKEEVVSDHIRCMLRPGEKVDYRTTSPQDAQIWLQQYLDFAVKVPAMSQRDFELIGARVTYFLDRRVGGLLYNRVGTEHLASLFILNGKGLNRFFVRNPNKSYRSFANRGYKVASWNDGDVLYFLISHDFDTKDIAVDVSDIDLN